MQLDLTISLGNILTMVTIVLLGFGAWSRLEQVLARLDERTLGHGKILERHDSEIRELLAHK